MNTAPIPGSREISYLSISQEYLKSFSVTYRWIRRVVCDLWSDKPWCLDALRFLFTLSFFHRFLRYCIVTVATMYGFFCSIEVFSIHAD